jgi:YD repeat-containing protein
LLTQVSYQLAAPNPTNIPAAPSVTFGYDALGNRTQMTDGLGTIVYEYNELSQLTAETRQFADSLPNAPLANNGFRLEYGYNLTGALKSLQDPFGQRFDYAHDKTGRLDAVTGASAFGGVTNYAANARYRAWGALKQIGYGDNPAQADAAFDNRLRVSNFAVTKPNLAGGAPPQVVKKQYEYNADGRLKFSRDELNALYDRTYLYDFAGRLTRAHTAPQPPGLYTPHDTRFFYDAFGNRTAHASRVWNELLEFNYSAATGGAASAFVNNRLPDVGYDADGRATAEANGLTSVYDAAGRLTKTGGQTFETELATDGDGRELKRRSRRRANNAPSGAWRAWQTAYLIRSTVLGGETITEAGATGEKKTTYIYGSAGGSLLAKQNVGVQQQQTVEWIHAEPSGASVRATQAGSQTISPFGSGEREPTGTTIPAEQSEPFLPDSAPIHSNGLPGFDSRIAGQNKTCYLDGVEMLCATVSNLMGRGGAERCPNDDCGPRPFRVLGADGVYRDVLSRPFGASADGRSGYWVPIWGRVNMVNEDGSVERDDSPEIIDWNFKEARGNNEPCGDFLDCLKKLVELYKKEKACDKYLSNLFGDEGAYFFDNTRWTYDSIMGNRIDSGTTYGVDSHLYGSKTDPTKSTNIYVPKGFKPVIPHQNFANTRKGLPANAPNNQYLGRENNSDGTFKQNYTLFYNSELKLTLAIWHVDDYGIKKQADGRTRIGTIGFSTLSGGSLEGLGKNGGHAHFDLYYSPNIRTSLPHYGVRPRIRRSFRIFCP